MNRFALFDADDTREKYFSGATRTARVPNSGIRDGATKYKGPRSVKANRFAGLSVSMQAHMDQLLNSLHSIVIEEQAVLDYISHSEAERDFELSLRSASLPGWLFDNSDLNRSLMDWAVSHFTDSFVPQKKLVADGGVYTSLEDIIRTWTDDAPTLTPDSFYELETAVISLHPSD